MKLQPSGDAVTLQENEGDLWFRSPTASAPPLSPPCSVKFIVCPLFVMKTFSKNTEKSNIRSKKSFRGLVYITSNKPSLFWILQMTWGGKW